MANTPPSVHLPPNNGKSNAGEAPDAPNLNMPLPAPQPPTIHGQGATSPPATNKGKEVMVETNQPPPNPNKRKSIVLGGPDHHPRAGDDHGPKNPRIDGAQEEGGDNENTSPSLQETRGTINNPERNYNVPQVYICDFCNKRFSSPQALGGHQNGHKMERQIRNEMEAMNKNNQTLPSLMPFTGTYGPSLTPMNMTTQYLQNGYSYNTTPNNNPMMMGYGNHHQYGVPINGTFQYGIGTTPGLDATAAGGAIMPHGNNTSAPFYQQWASGDTSIWNNGTGFNYPNPGGYETGYYNNNAGGYYGSYGALDPGYGGAIYHPQGSLYNYPEFEYGYYSGGGGGGSGYYGGFQQPDPAWMNYGGIPIPSTGYHVGIDNNTYGLYHGQVDAMAYDPLQQGVTGTLSSGNDYLRYQNTGVTSQQQVAMVGMDFGSVPEGEGGHGGTDDEIQEEEAAIDLTLKL